LQLLARLGSRPTIADIVTPIFRDGLHPKDVIELCGPEGTGKSEILLNAVASVILPKRWKSIPLNGKDASVIYIDNDYKFSILRLVTLMENRISTNLKTIDQQDLELSQLTNDIEVLIKKCLSKLSIVRCASSSEFLVTLYSLEQTLLSNPNISVVMIDSISAFYWVDKCNNGESLAAQEKNMRLATEVLSKFVNNFSLIVIATKCAYFKKRKHDEDFNSEASSIGHSENFKTDHQDFLCKAWGQFVTKRFLLEKHTFTNSFRCCCMETRVNKTDRSATAFKITENGVQSMQ
jgi:DNA-repair protein XRCC2